MSWIWARFWSWRTERRERYLAERFPRHDDGICWQNRWWGERCLQSGIYGDPEAAIGGEARWCKTHRRPNDYLLAAAFPESREETP